MSKITLEDGAQYIAQECKSVTGYEARLADLIRAAQKVVDAADKAKEFADSLDEARCPFCGADFGGPFEMSGHFDGCQKYVLGESLAEFRKLEEGE